MFIPSISLIYVIKHGLSLEYLFYVCIIKGYPWDIPDYVCLSLVYPYLYFFYKKIRRPGGWCRRSGGGPAALVPPTMASVCRVSSWISLMPCRAARHTGALAMCTFTAMSVEYDVKNMPRSAQLAQTYRFVWVIRVKSKSVPAEIKASASDRVQPNCMPRSPVENFWGRPVLYISTLVDI